MHEAPSAITLTALPLQTSGRRDSNPQPPEPHSGFRERRRAVSSHLATVSRNFLPPFEHPGWHLGGFNLSHTCTSPHADMTASTPFKVMTRLPPTRLCAIDAPYTRAERLGATAALFRPVANGAAIRPREHECRETAHEVMWYSHGSVRCLQFQHRRTPYPAAPAGAIQPRTPAARPPRAVRYRDA